MRAAGDLHTDDRAQGKQRVLLALSDARSATLADRRGVSDVAVSKTLRRAERKLLGAAVSATDGLRDDEG